MSDFKVSEIFIGAGAALSPVTTAMPSIAVQTGIVGGDMLVLDPAGVDTITSDPLIYIVNKLANGDFKRSLPIIGTHVTGYAAEKYAPAQREIYSVGYKRASVTNTGVAGAAVAVPAGGAIEVCSSTVYELSIVFQNDKSFYSVRPEVLRIEFTSSATATQLSIATQIAKAINNSAFGASPAGVKELIAIVVSDGPFVAAVGTAPAIYGDATLAVAANYGVEITGLVINQFQSTQYGEELVYFSVHINDATGFGTTPSVEIQAMDIGTGTYNQVYNMENKFQGNEAILNRRLWPVTPIDYLTLAAGFQSGALVPTATAVINNDIVTFSAPVYTGGGIEILFPGSSITLGGVKYEIKYFKTDSIAVLTTPLLAAQVASAVTAKAFYDIININVTDMTTLSGSGAGMFSQKNIFIATPAIIVGGASMLTPSLEGQDLMDILNAWMTSTPLSPANILI